MRPHLMYLALVLAALMSTVSAEAQPIRVFVTRLEAPAPLKPTDADAEAASAAYNVADKARKALENTLKAQYGNKRDKWPAEAQNRFADAEEARDRSNADWQYRLYGEWFCNLWANDLDRALVQSGMTGRKEYITSVPSADEAQLIVTVTRVRRVAGIPRGSYNRCFTVNGDTATTSRNISVTDPAVERCLTFQLARGPKLSAEQFALIPRAYRPRRFQAKRLEGPSESSPVWLFEGCGVSNNFSELEAIANIVNDFAGTHLQALTGSGRQ
jgi:hypothetical protein